MARRLRIREGGPEILIGIGGIGTGLFFALEGNHTLGRNESRPARLLEGRDYCKLHIISHYVAVLLDPSFVVLPVGKVGNDPQGRRLLEEMAEAGIDTRFVEVVSGHPTLLSVCFQYPDGTGGNLTTTNGAASLLQPADLDPVAPILAEKRGRMVAVAAPEVSLVCRLHLLRLATDFGAFRVASFLSAEMEEACSLGIFDLVDLLVINEDEAGRLIGEEFAPEQAGRFLDKLAALLSRRQPQMRAVMSAGQKGAYAGQGNGWQHCPAPTVEIASTAGAGDALTAGILCGLLAGLPLAAEGEERGLSERPVTTALDLGVLLGSFSTTSPHTIHPEADLDRLLAFAAAIGPGFSEAVLARCTL